MSEQEDQLEGGWIQWFINLEDHQFFCEIDEEFIKDKFNFYGIKQSLTHFQLKQYIYLFNTICREAMDMVLSKDAPEDEDLEDEKFLLFYELQFLRFLETYQEASDLYGLLHARFILTPRGMAIMREKYLVGKFGICSRFLCEKQQVLPLGISDDLKVSRVKVYCPRCEDIYIPKKRCSDVDGAYFGTSFPHIFLQSFPDLIPAPSTETYVPKISGFKLFKKNGSDYWKVPENNKEELKKKEKEHEKLSLRFKQFEKKTAVDQNIK